jgi:hypothetical protein
VADVLCPSSFVLGNSPEKFRGSGTVAAPLEGAAAVFLAVLPIHDPEFRDDDPAGVRIVLEVYQQLRIVRDRGFGLA